ncbi:MAG: hypothetical protein WDA65_05350 [Christensenellales bacterium]
MEKQQGDRLKVRMHELNYVGSKKKTDSKRQPQITERPKTTVQTEKRSAGSFVIELVVSVLLIAAINALRTVQVYASNVHLVTFNALAESMWLYMGISIACFAVLRIFLRKPYFACIFASFGIFLAINFEWLVDLTRIFINKYEPAVIGGLLLYVVIVTGFLFIVRLLFKKNFPIHTVAKILSATFSCLVLFNVVLASVAIAGQAQTDDNTEDMAQAPAAVYTAPPIDKTYSSIGPATTPDTGNETFGIPNVYFFILDEYGTFDIVEKYYGYDNKVFYDFLTMQGFNISRESYSTDNQTANCFADLLNLKYISRKYSKNDCLKAIQGAKLFEEFSGLGYSQFQIAKSKYFPDIDSLNPDAEIDIYEDANMFGDEATGDVSDTSIAGALLKLFSPTASDTQVDKEALNKWGFYPSHYIRDSKEYKQHKDSGYADALLAKFDYFEDTDNYVFSGPRVIYCYMTATHVPFVFNEYGGIIPYKERRNWEEISVYLNQYKFITKHMIVSLSTIIENDPDSVIIIMSDHGIRYHADCSKKHTFYITNKESCRVMNAVYIKGQKYDIEGLSGINTLRYVLSLYEGLDYPPIEDPVSSDSPDGLKGIIPKPRWQ